jgi:hypothetical protein
VPIGDSNQIGDTTHDMPKEWNFPRNHPKEQVIGEPSHGVRTHSSLRDICNNLAFITQNVPKTIEEVESDEN